MPANAAENLEPVQGAEEEAPPSSRRGDFGFGAAKELRRLESAAAAARSAAEADPGNASLEKQAFVAEKRLELFDLEHDQGGAFKFNRFGRDMVKMFEPGADGEAKIAIDAETGRLSLAESEKGRRLLFVNMGELDRVNKEGGGHAAGDAALKESADAIEAALRSVLGSDIEAVEAQVVRYSGNEYMVSMNGVSEERAAAIGEAVRTYWTDMASTEAGKQLRAEKLAAIGITDPPPFTVSGFEMQEVLDIMSEMQLELEPSERISPDAPGQAASDFIEAMRLRANYGLDVGKFSDRVKRVRSVFGDASRSAEQKRAFFDTYLRKMFPAELSSGEAVAALTDEQAEEAAFEYAAQYLDGALTREKAKEAIISRRAEEIRATRGAPAFGPRLEITPPGSAKLAEIPERTRGQQLLEAAKVAALSAAEAGNEDDRAVAEVLRDVETASRDAGTGLLTRNKHYQDLQEAFRDGREVSQVFIDMGFLKLFDKSGGSDVGDKALKMAAHLIEQALEKSGLEGRAYRYAGDEFTVQLDGGIANATEFRKALKELTDQAGSIPAGKNRDRGNYIPTELVFNCGESDAATAEAVYADLVAAGVYTERELDDPERVLNEKAHLMTVIADKGIEKDKAVDRFLLLVNSLRDPQYATDAVRTKQVDGILKYSDKAIYGEAGGRDFLKALVAGGKSVEELRPEITKWVEQRMAAAPEQKSRKLELTNRLIELHGKIAYYKQEKHRAENAEVVTSMELNRVKAMLESAQRDRQALIEARKALE